MKLLNHYFEYRRDIDGLRAIAVFSAILFHLEYMPNGYLGVDMFFVISGYLITNIITKETLLDNFSIVKFYDRRIRRILPMSGFITFVALVVGIVTMLPDDLENLAQSVVATNIFSNNILQAITTKNYWDVVNEYKPLMHTWSLGVEEQYYFIYPIILGLALKKSIRTGAVVVFGLALASLLMYIFSAEPDYKKFYFVHFRFWELAFGGFVALLTLNRKIDIDLRMIMLLALGIILTFGPSLRISETAALVLTVFLTAILLVPTSRNSRPMKVILENKFIVYIGLISFSMYLWHQVLIAYTRYVLVRSITFDVALILMFLTIALSTLSYSLIEKPARNKEQISSRLLFVLLTILILPTTVGASFLYLKGGVTKDVPELDITRDSGHRNMHALYNSEPYKLDVEFSSINKIKVLVIGNSFARDWVNVLRESSIYSELELSYIFFNEANIKKIIERNKNSDIVFYATSEELELPNTLSVLRNVYIIGTKNYGKSNGLFYNYSGSDYFDQRTRMEEKYYEIERTHKANLGDQYISLIEPVIDANGFVPIFTEDKKFISQDVRHFTKAGAEFYARILNDRITSLLLEARL